MSQNRRNKHFKIDQPVVASLGTSILSRTITSCGLTLFISSPLCSWLISPLTKHLITSTNVIQCRLWTFSLDFHTRKRSALDPPMCRPSRFTWLRYQCRRYLVLFISPPVGVAQKSCFVLSHWTAHIEENQAPFRPTVFDYEQKKDSRFESSLWLALLIG